MIPGTTTKLTESKLASATVINAKTDIVVLTGAATIQTIIPNFGGGVASGMLILVPQGAAVLGTTGNILVGTTCIVNRPLLLTYVKSLGKWLIHSTANA